MRHRVKKLHTLHSFNSLLIYPLRIFTHPIPSLIFLSLTLLPLSLSLSFSLLSLSLSSPFLISPPPDNKAVSTPLSSLKTCYPVYRSSGNFCRQNFSYVQLCTKIKCTEFFIAVYKVCMLLRQGVAGTKIFGHENSPNYGTYIQ